MIELLLERLYPLPPTSVQASAAGNLDEAPLHLLVKLVDRLQSKVEVEKVVDHGRDQVVAPLQPLDVGVDRPERLATRPAA